MGSVSVSSCRCYMFVSCVHPVAVLNAAFSITCSLLMLVEDAIGDHTEEEYLCCACGCCGDCDACTVVCVAWVCAVRV